MTLGRWEKRRGLPSAFIGRGVRVRFSYEYKGGMKGNYGMNMFEDMKSQGYLQARWIFTIMRSLLLTDRIQESRSQPIGS